LSAIVVDALAAASCIARSCCRALASSLSRSATKLLFLSTVSISRLLSSSLSFSAAFIRRMVSSFECASASSRCASAA